MRFEFDKLQYKSQRLTIAKKDIIDCFNKLDKKVFKYSEIADVLKQNREFWRASNRTTTEKFIAFLINEVKRLGYVKLEFPSKDENLFSWGYTSFYEIIMSINREAYFSHYSAVFFNELTEQIPKTFYLNVELKPARFKNTGLLQDRIDLAFRNKPRVSNNIAEFENRKICILNGKFTDKLGVQERVLEDGTKIRVTNIERTLIDIVVRPFYSGGIYEVLNAYKKAVNYVSINKLNAYLNELDYTYPYHQAIGFLLEKAGVFKENQIELLRKRKFEFDFYLTHQIENPNYSEKWRLYYPKGF